MKPIMIYTKSQINQFKSFCDNISQLGIQLEADHFIDVIPYNKKGNKIHIKKENRGKFTDYCNGKVTSECIQRGKNSPDPKIRKRATFAANARTWKHQLGGVIKAIKLLSKNDYAKVLQKFKDVTKITPNNMIEFRKATNKDDRFLQGILLKEALEKQKVPSHYVGHGMVKQVDPEALAAARMMNQHGYDISRPFHSGSLVGSKVRSDAAGGFYSDGPFIIVSDTRQPRGTISHILINDSYENPAGRKLAEQYRAVLDRENPNIPKIFFSDIINGTYKFQ